MCCQEFTMQKRKGKIYLNISIWGGLLLSGILAFEHFQIALAQKSKEGPNIPPTIPPMRRNKPPILPCGADKKLKSDDEYFIESPEFGTKMKYPNHVRCNWKFETDNCRMGLSCPNFRLAEFLCFDHMDIVDNNNGTMHRYCGKNGPQEMVLSDNVTISFTSSAFSWDEGFRCRVVCRDAGGGTPVFPKPEAEPSECDCGVGRVKVTGGEPTEIYVHPWQAGLVRKGGFTPFCGGSLINSKYVLTAGHCVIGRTPYNLEIRFNISEIGDQGGAQMEIRRTVENILLHRQYNSRLDYDAALIRLDEPVNITHHQLRPVCLPTEKDLAKTYAGWNATLTGWGLTSEDGDLSDTLMETQVEIISNEDCAKHYPSITDRMLCAFTPGKDACQGDSGGPLVVALGGGPGYGGVDTQHRSVQVGIVSWGQGCGENPGVYTRVTELLKWIATNTKDGSYCSNT